MCEGLLIALFLCEDWQHGLEVQRALLHTFSSACPPDVILLYRYIYKVNNDSQHYFSQLQCSYIIYMSYTQK